MSWVDAHDALASRVVVIPFAAGAKEHGPHLPLGTDQLVMEHLLDAAVRERNVLVAPPILHGWFPAFRDYPGTEIADPAVFQAYVTAVAESLIRHGATRLVFLNTGISRATGLPLAIVARDIRANHDIATLVVSWDDLESSEIDALLDQKRGGHADEAETSIILHLRPDLVNMERAVTAYRGEAKPQIGYRPGKFNRATEPGLFGDPTLATAAKGEKLLEIMRRNWLHALDQFESL
ncbi:MAG: creatininase family protein [Gammaproteobacteria bacterium]|nr:creatininase family protein [Gammaproteobacteria bacterium]